MRDCNRSVSPGQGELHRPGTAAQSRCAFVVPCGKCRVAVMSRSASGVGQQEPMRRVDRHRRHCCGRQKLRWRLGVRWEELLPRQELLRRVAGDAVAQETQFRAAGAALRIAGGVAAVPQETPLRVANSRARHVQEMIPGRRCRYAVQQEPCAW